MWRGEGNRELQEDEPHAEDVHGVVVWLVVELFRGHVGQGANLVSVSVVTMSHPSMITPGNVISHQGL